MVTSIEAKATSRIDSIAVGLALVIALSSTAAAQDPNIPHSPTVTTTASASECENATQSGVHARADLTVEDLMHRRAPAAPAAGGKWKRWLDLSSAAFGVRSRTLDIADDRLRTNQIQLTAALRGGVKMDSGARLTVHFGLATGRGFTGGWNTTGIGSGASTHDFSVKQLYASVAASKAVDVEAGGLHLLRGESTEATSYDNDGYIVGERIVLRPGHGLDTLSFTRAFLGDLDRSSVFGRLHGLGRTNYYQALAEKRLGDASMSVDYTSQAGTRVVRGAMSVPLPSLWLADRARIESYFRLNAGAFGYALAFHRRSVFDLMALAGISSVDSSYAPVNGDLYGRGQRVFASISRRFSTAWLASGQFASSLGRGASAPHRRFDASVAYDLLSALRPRHRQSTAEGRQRVPH